MKRQVRWIGKPVEFDGLLEERADFTLGESHVYVYINMSAGGDVIVVESPSETTYINSCSFPQLQQILPAIFSVDEKAYEAGIQELKSELPKITAIQSARYYKRKRGIEL